MGQAFDERGNILGEAYGDTKQEVFDKLNKAHADAHEIRIKTLREKVEGAGRFVEELAHALHESGREAVEKGLVVNKIPGQPFYSWDQLTEEAKEGRRVQARYLIREGWVARRPGLVPQESNTF